MFEVIVNKGKLPIVIVLCFALGDLLNFPFIFIFIPSTLESNILLLSKVKAAFINFKKKLWFFFSCFSWFAINSVANSGDSLFFINVKNTFIPSLKKGFFSKSLSSANFSLINLSFFIFYIFWSI